MRISVLSENKALDERFCSEHGLSLHIAYGEHNILFDMGASANFVRNASVLGIDIGEVDYAVISHGHDDHGGGLATFLDVNSRANVYVHALAFGEYYSKKSSTFIKRIGLDTSLQHHERVILIDRDTEIVAGVRTMCNVEHRYPLPRTNSNLLVKSGDSYARDDFRHEQDLAVRYKGGYVLLVACAHNGIKNILEHAKRLYGTMPTHVFGGFHLRSRTQNHETDEEIDALGEYLMSTGAHFYTCHCTGEDAYARLKKIMGNKIEYFSTGCAVDIE